MMDNSKYRWLGPAILGFLLLLSTAGIVLGQGTGEEEGTPLVGTQWILAEMGPVDNTHPIAEGLTITLTLDPTSKLYGSAGCNRYTSSYRVIEYQLSIGPIGSTRMMCPQDVMDQEHAYLRALGLVSRYELEQDSLRLYYEGSSQVLLFRPKTPQELEAGAGAARIAITAPPQDAVVSLAERVLVQGVAEGFRGSIVVRAEDEAGKVLAEEPAILTEEAGEGERAWHGKLRNDVEAGTHGKLVAYGTPLDGTVISDTVEVTFGLVAPSPAAPLEDGRIYVVQEGDWLAKIAYEQLGDGTAWEAIIAATNAKAAVDDRFDTINDAHVIEVGQLLWIPVMRMEAAEAEPAATTETAAAPTLTPTPPPTLQPTLAPTAAITNPLVLRIRNAALLSAYAPGGMIQLDDGEYHAPPAEGASRGLAIYLTHVALGDLNGDSVEDAVAVLATDPGTSSTFRDLVAFVTHAGTPVPVARAFLGDRVRITAVHIEGGQVIVEMLKHAPDDPICCPSQEAVQRYALELVPLGLG